MPRKSFNNEQIISKLREAKMLLSQGQTTRGVCRSFNISEQTYYRLAERIQWGTHELNVVL